jgi:hypothetical protein
MIVRKQIMLYFNESKTFSGFVARLSFVAFVVIGLTSDCCGQSPSIESCAILGRDTVIAGSAASYTLSTCTTGNWTSSCGTIVAQNSNNVTLNLGGVSCNTVTITAAGGSAAGISKTVTILAVPAYSAGVIAAMTQTIPFNSIPEPLVISQATGGLCNGSYSYQWLSSSDSLHFDTVPGATGQNYQPGPLTSTTYYERQTLCTGSGTKTSGIIKVTVHQSFAGAQLNPAVQMGNSKASLSTITVTLPAEATNLRVLWQSSSDPGFTNPVTISSAQSGSLIPDSITSTTYYRAVILDQRDSFYSSPAVVNIYPPVNGGTLIPATQSITADSLSGLITCTRFSGGDGNYGFQWYSSPDGINWSPMPGVRTAGYNPGVITATTWYQVQVNSNGAPVASTKAVIYVNR